MNGEIKILQCNLNKSIQATENALQLGIELKIDIIAVQEPWLAPNQEKRNYEGVQSIRHTSYSQLFPTLEDNQLRPRAMFYISNNIGLKVEKSGEYPNNPDFITLKLAGIGGDISIVNIYNQKN